MADTTWLDEIEARANAATPGPWCVAGMEDEVHDADGEPVAEMFSEDMDQWAPDASYIAAVNPQTVLRLTTALRDALARSAELTRTGQAMIDAMNEEARLELKHERVLDNESAYTREEIQRSMDETTSAIVDASAAIEAFKTALKASESQP